MRYSTSMKTFFDYIFSIFDSIHFLKCLMIVVLKKKFLTVFFRFSIHFIFFTAWCLLF